MADPGKQGLLRFGFTHQKLSKGEQKPPPTAALLARDQLERDQAAARKAQRQADEQAAAAAPKRKPGRPKAPKLSLNPKACAFAVSYVRMCPYSQCPLSFHSLVSTTLRHPRISAGTG